MTYERCRAELESDRPVMRLLVAVMRAGGLTPGEMRAIEREADRDLFRAIEGTPDGADWHANETFSRAWQDMFDEEVRRATGS